MAWAMKNRKAAGLAGLAAALLVALVWGVTLAQLGAQRGAATAAGAGEWLVPYAACRAQALWLAAFSTAVILACGAGALLAVRQAARSRARARADGQARLRFLANMSHELRTPLNGILGYSELLGMELEGSRLGGFAGAIHTSGRRLLGLVEAILELSALEAGRTVLAPRREALDDTLRQALAPHAAAAAARGVALDCRRGAGAPDVVHCDRAKLLRVLDILLRNALAATDAGAVRLSVAAARGGLLFQVCDSGCGVPPELRRKIFQRFAQGDDGAARTKEGAGLGLAIAAGLVGLTGGAIWVDGAAGGGAVFSFTLPQAADAAAPAPLEMTA